MVILRQRLLLVAGWIAAAIGAGLVASAAVAVAGGQVLDRPLRPFTAAEVASLPVVEVETPDVVEPHASGGLEPIGDSTQGSDDVRDPNESASTGGSTTAPLSPPPPIDPINAQPLSIVRTSTVDGGTASFAFFNGQFLFLWAAPQAGYIVTTHEIEDGYIRVEFTSTLAVWVLTAHMDAGEIVIEVSNEPIL